MSINEIFDFIGENKKGFFVDKLNKSQVGVIKIALLRETINPIIIRSNDPEATIVLSVQDGRELVEIPARKLKSREKLLGLRICRKMEAVHEEVKYNSIFEVAHLANPNSVLFGDSVTQSDGGALNSRAIYDWAYSLRDAAKITDKFQHNSTNEEGKILSKRDVTKDEKKQTDEVASQALHSVEYVLPQTYFPHFITLTNATPEMLFHLLVCILNQHEYGAQTNVIGANINNHLIAIGFSDFEKPINSFVISKEWNKVEKARIEKEKKAIEIQAASEVEGETKGKAKKPFETIPNLENVKAFMLSEITKHYGSNTVTDIESLVKWVNETYYTEGVKNIYGKMKTDASTYLVDMKMVKPEGERPPRTVGKASKGKAKPKEETETDNQEPNLFDV